MTHYLDTSVIISLVQPDIHSPKAAAWMERVRPVCFVSDFGKLEFASVISRHVRSNRLAGNEGRAAAVALEEWLSRTTVVGISHEDIATADAMVLDFATKLTAADAIHLAIAKRLGLVLATFDQRLAAAAERHATRSVVPD